MVMTIDCRSRSSKPWQVPKKCQPQGQPDRKAGNSSACARPAHPGRGHRPCHSVPLPPGQPGAQSPRPAPAPPPAGASRPPGRALACRCDWTCRSTGNRLARAGETQCVSCSRPKGQSPSPNREDFSGGRRSDCLYSILLKKRPLSVGRMARPVMARIALKRPEQNRCRSSQLTEVRRQPEIRCAGLVERPGDQWRA
jgi:hypothetical protein